MTDRMFLVVFSGTSGRLTAAATLATGAAAMGMEVELFFTYCGLETIKKGAKTRLPRITAEFADYGPVMMELFGNELEDLGISSTKSPERRRSSIVPGCQDQYVCLSRRVLL